MSKTKKQEDYGAKLQESYDRWEHLYKYGASDPFWEDGVNLNLVRNHILSYRRQIEENPTLIGLPEAYKREIPPEVDNRYMARADEIRVNARATLDKYLKDPNYLYIVEHYNDFTPKTREKLHIDNVLGYVSGLRKYIEEDKLVDMRRHENHERYAKSFEDCVKKMQATPPEIVQTSLFSPAVNLATNEIDDEDVAEDDEDFEEDEADVFSEYLREIAGVDPDELAEYDPKGYSDNGNEFYDENNEDSDNDSDTNEIAETQHPVNYVATPIDSDEERFANIPEELKSLKQWTVFKTYPDNKSGKLKKVIVSPVNACFARSDESHTWASYEQAKGYMQRHKYKGLVFALDEGMAFIDIDHAINKDTGEIISPQAKQLLELFLDTYTEKSVSGTGIHILVKGSLPLDSYRRNDKAGIEMYDKRRFICMTGDVLNGSKEIKDYSNEIGQIAYDFVGKRQPVREYKHIAASQSDTDLTEAISKSKQGTKFNALYAGNIGAYPSHSHADSALVFTLAWWTQDPNQIDRIVRSSGLMREKWDSRRGNGTYGSQLINEALSTVRGRQAENYL